MSEPLKLMLVEWAKHDLSEVKAKLVEVERERDEWKEKFYLSREKHVLAASDRDNYRKALEDAAQSLETLSGAGYGSSDLDSIMDARQYAHSRATVAREALEEPTKPQRLIADIPKDEWKDMFEGAFSGCIPQEHLGTVAVLLANLSKALLKEDQR